MTPLTRRAWQGLRPPRTVRTSWRSIFVLLIDGALMALATVCCHGHGLLRLCAWLSLTVAFLHLYLLHHECVHRAVFVDARRNRWLGQLLGFVLLYPFLPRRRSHLGHHAWTGCTARDPASARAVARFASLSPRGIAMLSLTWRCGLPLLALSERVGLWLEPFRTNADAPSARAERRANMLYLCGYALLTCFLVWRGLLGCVLALYLPALLGLLVVEELINLPHHLHDSVRGNPVALWQQTEVTHSCAGLPLWSSALLLHFNLHSAHHLFPHAPWHELPALERALSARGTVRTVEHELLWSLRARRQPFRRAFRDYFPPPRT